MPRLNRKSELFQNITEVGVFRDAAGGGSSTATGSMPAADSQAVLNVVSGTNFVTDDWVRVRANDNYPEITRGVWAAAAFTPYYFWHRAPIVGDPVVEVSQVALGHIEKSGVKFTASADLEEVQSATRRLSIADLLGYVKPQLEFGVLGYNLENLMVAMGMLDTAANIGGTQTAADPLRAFINGAQLKEQNDLCWYVNGTRKDGRQLFLQAWGCEVDFTKAKHTLGRGKQAVIPVSLVPTHAIRFIEID